MAVSPGKRISMTLYSGPMDIHSHVVRIVLAQKEIPVDGIHVNPEDIPEELMAINPYQSLPTLVDRDLVLYGMPLGIMPILEYFDERYPHPPLLPGYPVARAECRLMISRIEYDWFRLVPYIEGGTDEQIELATKNLRDSLVSIDSIFTNHKYFMGEDYTLVDCMMSPLLWRLPHFKIQLPPQATHLKQYMKNLFARPSFQASLSEVERELHTEKEKELA